MAGGATVQYDVAIRNAIIDAIVAEIGDAAILRYYSGGAPANPAAAASGILLAHLTCGTPFAPPAVNGATTANPVTQQDTPDAQGIIGHFRIYKAGGINCVCQGTVGTIGSGADIEVNTQTTANGVPVMVSGITLTAPGQ